MNIKTIKQYIMYVLIHNCDKITVSPDLLIDRLFDNMSIDMVQDIAKYRAGDTPYADDVKQLIWDRYLLPSILPAESYVKILNV